MMVDLVEELHWALLLINLIGVIGSIEDSHYAKGPWLRGTDG